jgi:hypothetical protein
MRRAGLALSVLAAAGTLTLLAVCGVARASWAVGLAGNGATKAKTMPAGNVPSGTVSGRSVTLTWTASAFAGGGNSPAYVIRRFNSLTQAEATVLSACSGLVAATTCTENNVPLGTWQYTVTPAAGAWRGTQSGKSAVLLVTL